jgi:hypothetical protein
MNFADVFTVCDFVNYSESKDELVNAQVLENAGYVHVSINTSSFWIHAHEWCKKQYGKDKYIWTGEKFWFDTKEEAARFYAYYKDWLED